MRSSKRYQSGDAARCIAGHCVGARFPASATSRAFALRTTTDTSTGAEDGFRGERMAEGATKSPKTTDQRVRLHTVPVASEYSAAPEPGAWSGRRRDRIGG